MDPEQETVSPAVSPEARIDPEINSDPDKDSAVDLEKDTGNDAEDEASDDLRRDTAVDLGNDLGSNPEKDTGNENDKDIGNDIENDDTGSQKETSDNLGNDTIVNLGNETDNDVGNATRDDLDDVTGTDQEKDTEDATDKETGDGTDAVLDVEKEGEQDFGQDTENILKSYGLFDDDDDSAHDTSRRRRSLSLLTIKGMFLLCWSTVGWIACLIIALPLALGIPISMIVMGSLYVDDCPAQRYIPIYLVVMGVGTLLRHVFSAIRKCCCDDEANRGCRPEFILDLFLFAWFIAGNVWIYGTNNEYSGDPASPVFCDAAFFSYAFWLTTAAYIAVGVSIVVALLGACIAACVALAVA